MQNIDKVSMERNDGTPALMNGWIDRIDFFDKVSCYRETY
jgi:hypothetical protein